MPYKLYEGAAGSAIECITAVLPEYLAVFPGYVVKFRHKKIVFLPAAFVARIVADNAMEITFFKLTKFRKGAL